MNKYKIGVDLGGTTIGVGLVDENNKIIDEISGKTNLPRPEHEIEKAIADLCFELVKRNNINFESQITSLGIGTPGSVNSKTGVVEFNANFGYHNWKLVEGMEKLVPCKVYIENDANAAAFGEYIGGAAKNAKYAVMVTLGTGIGGGIIIDGKIFSGFNSAGAEIGHIVIEKDGRPCMCGRNGCWEKYASSRALAENTKEAMEQNKDNMMWGIVGGDITKVNAKTAFDAMRAGDELGTKVVNDYIEYVACGLTNIINIFQPEIICIGGGISKEGEALLAPIRAYVDSEDYARNSEHRTKIVVAELRNSAGIIGAACLGEQE